MVDRTSEPIEILVRFVAFNHEHFHEADLVCDASVEISHQLSHTVIESGFFQAGPGNVV